MGILYLCTTKSKGFSKRVMASPPSLKIHPVSMHVCAFSPLKLQIENEYNRPVGTEKRREKVVVVWRELQRAIIYTRELSKQAIEDHVSTAFIVY
jgi:hypothetical protein